MSEDPDADAAGQPPSGSEPPDADVDDPAATDDDPDDPATTKDDPEPTPDELEPESEPDPDADADAATDADSDADDPAATDADSDADADLEAVDDEEPTDGIESGDFVRLHYTIRTAENGTVVDTTREDVAVEEGLETDDRAFEPRTIVVGAGHAFAPVDESLVGQTTGDAGTITVTAADAFGEHDPEEVRTVSADRIPEDDRYPGAHVDIDGQHGHVSTIIGGRARVDFNHPLAGQDLEYEYEIVGVVDDRLEKANALFDIYLDLDLDAWIETDTVEPHEDDDELEEVDAQAEEAEAVEEEEAPASEPGEPVERETLFVDAVPQLSLNQRWLFQKQRIAQEIIDHVGVDRVIIQEVLEGTGFLQEDLPTDIESLMEEADTEEGVEPDDIAAEVEEALAGETPGAEPEIPEE